MRTLYHEFESLEHLLGERLLPGGGKEPIRFVVFGGTGAVGGASVLELCRMILMSRKLRQPPLSGEIYATGMSDKDISKFAGRLYLALADDVAIDKLEPLRHYRIDGRIDLRFSVLQLEVPQDLGRRVADRRRADPELDLEQALDAYFGEQECPFLRFTESLECELLHAVLVAIPLPSVATYTLGAIDRLVAEHRLGHAAQQRIKKSYLRTFIRGLAVVQQRHARHVVVAHTTAVGGMYRVDGGTPEIRLGFAHSALGKKLVDKKYFAEELTQLYLDHGFDVLETAAAIGIDGVELRQRLPLDRGVRGALAARAESADPPAIPAADLESPDVLLYPSLAVALAGEVDGPDAGAGAALDFGAGKALVVDAAIRSGENGIFSVGNCVALYHVMKVAIPEELAMVLVRHAVFGPERRRDWFHDKFSYYTETENSYFALRLLEAYPQLDRAHHGAFGLQAFQALGSATHQARMHELGLLMLVLRLVELGRKFVQIPEKDLVDGLSDLEGFLWRHTRIPCFEDLDGLDGKHLATLFGQLCEVDSMESAGRLLGFDARRHGLREPGRERFLARLATRIGRYLQSITSLGTPILYRSPRSGADTMLLGPYVAPLDLGVARAGDVHRAWRDLAASHGLPFEVARDWVIANNGFVDLRPLALGSVAKEPGPALAGQVCTHSTRQELETWLDTLPAGSYFTTGGTLALELRLFRLARAVRRRKIQLGTRETWKHLFKEDPEGRHLISPGLVETVRLYCEGLGKITGTEALWPPWGY